MCTGSVQGVDFTPRFGMIFLRCRDSRKRVCSFSYKLRGCQMKQQTTQVSISTQPNATVLLVGFSQEKMNRLCRYLRGCHVEVVRTLANARHKMKTTSFNIVFLNADMLANKDIASMSHHDQENLAVVAVFSDKNERSTIKGDCRVAFTKFCNVFLLIQCLISRKHVVV